MRIKKFIRAFFVSEMFVLFITIFVPVTVFGYGQSSTFVGPMSPGTVVTQRNDPYFTGPHGNMDFKDFVDYIISYLITPMFSLFLAAAVVFFLWNMMGVIRKSDQPEELAKMKEQAIWGIVAIAVMVSMWGLVAFFTGTFKLTSTQGINLDRFNQPL